MALCLEWPPGMARLATGKDCTLANNTSLDDLDSTIAAVPEPSRLVLLAIDGLTLGGIAIVRMRSRRREMLLKPLIAGRRNAKLAFFIRTGHKIGVRKSVL